MLGTIDPSVEMDREEYNLALIRNQVALQALGYQVYVQQRPVMVLFEGWDAAGKGGAIKRLTEKLDPRGYVVYPIAAPQGEDASRHYLYRFWRRLPESGQIAILDRSWYGRVMVERIESFCSQDDWKRAYREINQFERQLVDFGTILFKFWIHISQEEQLMRFESRSTDPLRSWKLTDEDWRNREKWDQYEASVNEMLLRTSTVTAPWTIVEGNNKLYARIKVLETVVDKLSQELHFEPPVEVKLKVTKEDKNGKNKKKKK